MRASPERSPARGVLWLFFRGRLYLQTLRKGHSLESDSLRMWVQLICCGVGIIAAAILFFILAFFLPPLGAAILATLIGFTLGAVMTVHVVRTGNYFITWEEERDKGRPGPRLPR